MKRFRFRLENLLGLREQQERLAKLKLGQAARRCEEIRLEIQRIQADQRSTGFAGLFDPAALYARQAYLTRLKLRRERLDVDLEAAEAVRRRELDAYTAAMRHAEVLRKLRERGYAEYRLDTMRQEDANLDDIVLSRQSSESHAPRGETGLAAGY